MPIDNVKYESLKAEQYKWTSLASQAKTTRLKEQASNKVTSIREDIKQLFRDEHNSRSAK